MKRITTILISVLIALVGLISYPIVIKAAGTSLGISNFVPDTQEPQNLATNITITTSEPISAVVIKLDFTNLNYDDARYNNGAFDTELAPVKTDNNGTVTFSRLRTDKGYSATNGIILTVLWQPVATGLASVQIDKNASSAVSFATSTNVLTNVSGSSTTITSSQLSNKPASPTSAFKQPAIMSEAQLHSAEEAAISIAKGSWGPLQYGRYIILGLGILLLIFGIICVLLLGRSVIKPIPLRKDE